MGFPDINVQKNNPIIEIFRIWKNFDRLRPEVWFVFISLVFVALGLIWLKVLWVLVLVGGFALFIYFVVGFFWMYKKL